MRVIFVVDDFGHDSQIAGGSMIVGLAFLRFELSYHDYVARTFLVRRDGMWLTPSFIPQLFEKAMIEAQKEQASLFTLELYSDEPNAREALNTWNPTSPLLSHSRQTSFKIELSKHPLPIG